MKPILSIALALMLAGCSTMGLGGDVFPKHPDWAQEAWDRSNQGGGSAE